MNVINATEITKDYIQGRFKKTSIRAVDNLSLNIGAGQVFGFLGPNGSGKTTLLKILLNIVFPSKGNASLFGLSVNNPQSRREVGYLSENPYFYDRMNAWQMLDFYGSIYGIHKSDIKRRSSEVLDMVGMKDAAKRSLRTYSKGMLQRVGLAQAIISKPKLVFLDEPTTGLDPMGRRMIKDVIRNLKSEGVTVVLNSHILSDVQDTCDTVGVIAKGKLLQTGSVAQLTIDQHVLHVRLDLVTDNILQKISHCSLSCDNIDERTIKISVKSSDDTPEIIERIIEAGGRIYEVRYNETSLEDAFINLINSEGNN